ncbi:MAG: hypothetical protein ABWY09_07890 [Stenotrophomonas maltophilia]
MRRLSRRSPLSNRAFWMMRERTPGNVASLTPRFGRRLQITRGTRNAGYQYRGGEGAAHDFLRVQEGRTGSRIAALVPEGLHRFQAGCAARAGCTPCIVRSLIQWTSPTGMPDPAWSWLSRQRGR